MAESQRVLILDDDEGNRRLLEIALRMRGFEADTAVAGREALAFVQTTAYAIALLDLNLPDITGLDVAKEIRSTNQEMVIMIATTDNDDAMLRRAWENGCDVFLVKPFDIDQLFTFFQGLDIKETRSSTDLIIVDSLAARIRRYRRS